MIQNISAVLPIVDSTATIRKAGSRDDVQSVDYTTAMYPQIANLTLSDDV